VFRKRARGPAYEFGWFGSRRVKSRCSRRVGWTTSTRRSRTPTRCSRMDKAVRYNGSQSGNQDIYMYTMCELIALERTSRTWIRKTAFSAVIVWAVFRDRCRCGGEQHAREQCFQCQSCMSLLAFSLLSF
jgi:hypothetical protein